MRKLVWFIIISLFVSLVLAIACLYSPAFSATLYYYGVEVAGVAIVNGITRGLTGMLMWGTTGLATATVIIIGIGLSFSIFLIVLKHYLWDKPVMQAARNRVGLGQQTPVTLQQDVSPVPLKTVTEKKEEAPAS